MIVEIPAYLDIISNVAPLIAAASVLSLLWLGLRRRVPGANLRLAISLALVLLAWLAAMWALATAGIFQARTTPQNPAVGLSVIVPVIVGLAILLRSPRVAALIDGMPAAWLVRVQVYRVLGGIFLAIWASGGLPGAFALPAGIGDVLVGLLAIPVAASLSSGARGAGIAAYAWNVLGIADLVIAVSTGFLSSPGPAQLLALDHPNLLISAFPLVMIPNFAVPLSLILHGLSLWQLRRGAGTAGRRSLRDGNDHFSATGTA
jgi:hypothetical protein